MFEPPEHLPKLRSDFAVIEWRRPSRLRELAAVGFGHHGQVKVARWRKAESLVQRKLPRRARQEIGAANNIRDALIGVIDYRGEMIGMRSVPTPYDHIAVYLRLKSHFAETSIDHG